MKMHAASHKDPAAERQPARIHALQHTAGSPASAIEPPHSSRAAPVGIQLLPQTAPLGSLRSVHHVQIAGNHLAARYSSKTVPARLSLSFCWPSTALSRRQEYRPRSTWHKTRSTVTRGRPQELRWRSRPAHGTHLSRRRGGGLHKGNVPLHLGLRAPCHGTEPGPAASTWRCYSAGLATGKRKRRKPAISRRAPSCSALGTAPSASAAWVLSAAPRDITVRVGSLAHKGAVLRCLLPD